VSNTTNRLLLLFSLTLFTVACAGPSASSGAPANFSGYLAFEQYAMLQPATTPSGQSVLRWRDPHFNHHYYGALIVEPVGIYPATGDTSPELQQMVEFLTTELRRSVAGIGILATEPGVNTARLNVALTGIDVSEQAMKPHEVIPAALRGRSAAGETFTIALSFETRITDSRTGRYLGSSVRRIVEIAGADGPDRAVLRNDLQLLVEDAASSLRELAQ